MMQLKSMTNLSSYLDRNIIQTKRKLLSVARSLNLPPEEVLVLKLVMSVQNLALKPLTYVEVAPVPGMIGPCKISGNSLPVFEFGVFHKKIMEFVEVTVEMARPKKLLFRGQIIAKPPGDTTRNNEELDVNDVDFKPFRDSFYTLAHYLYDYFPLTDHCPVKSKVEIGNTANPSSIPISFIPKTAMGKPYSADNLVQF